MIILENETARAEINPLGAELTRFFHQQNGIEYMWHGDPAFWGKHAPVLFPIVGTLKDNRYTWNGKSWSMGRHGFAREQQFDLEVQEMARAVFLLRENQESLAKYPFPFSFRIEYRLDLNQLYVTYTVSNTGSDNLFFSVGGHPAFRVPLEKDMAYEDYFLWFEQAEDAPRWPITSEGLIGNDPEPCLTHTHKLPLSRPLFYGDALVFKHLQSTCVSLRTNKSSHGLDLSFPGFPYLGIWAARDADFVCIEPWCGIADSVTTDGRLEHKEGIIQLSTGESWERGWSVTIY